MWKDTNKTADTPTKPGHEHAGNPPPCRQFHDVNTLQGKTLLVGLTLLDPDGAVSHEIQLFGTISRVNADAVILDCRETGRTLSIPAVFGNISRATPGSYTLKSSGTVITDPDYFSIWTIRNASAGFIDIYQASQH